MPYRVFMDRFMKPFEWQTNYNKRASNCEYILSIAMKHVFTQSEGSQFPNLFIDDRICKYFYLYRVYTQGFSQLGDTMYVMEDSNDISGMWIFSKSRGFEEIDFILYYIQGDAFAITSPYVYLEYMQRLIVVLQEQGFNNPVVFMPKTIMDSSDKFPDPSRRAYNSWNYVFAKYPNSKKILSGDSSGANIAISLLLLLSQDFPSGDIATDKVQPIELDAMLLISPLTKFNLHSDDVSDNFKSDFLDLDLVKLWGARYLQPSVINSDDIFLRYLGSPGLCEDKEIWKKAYPKYGVIITYGGAEVLAPEIEKFITTLQGIGKLKIDKHDSHIHNWPLLTYITERNVNDREESIDLFAGIFSRMLLWDTESYFVEGAKEPTPVIHIDDKFT